MILSFIVAVSDNNAIGIKGELPWNLPEDLKFFKRTTLGKPVIMGRKTYESLGRPLPGRLNIVLSNDTHLRLPEGVVLCREISEAIARAEEEKKEEAFIIGGGKIFEQSMHLADRMYITRVNTTVADADAFFPDVDHTHWKLVSDDKHTADEKHQYNYSFQQYERIGL